VVLVGSLRCPYSVSAEGGSYDSHFFSRGVLFLRDERVGFSKPKIPLGKCLCAYIIIHCRGERGAGVFAFLLLFVSHPHIRVAIKSEVFLRI